MRTPNKERIALLVAALRSKQYKQVKSALAKIDREKNIIGHCCLGVACEVAKANGVKLDTSFQCGCVLYADSVNTLPSVVARFFGFEDSNPDLKFSDRVKKDLFISETPLYSAAGANDKGATFAEIADAFERTYL